MINYETREKRKERLIRENQECKNEINKYFFILGIPHGPFSSSFYDNMLLSKLRNDMFECIKKAKRGKIK